VKSRLLAIRTGLVALARDMPTLLVSAGFLIVLTIATALYARAWKGDAPAEDFVSTGPGRLWLALALIQGVAWVVAGAVIWREAAWLRVEPRVFWARFAVVLVGIGLILALVFPVADVAQYHENPLPGWNPGVRIGAGLVAVLAVSWGATHLVCLRASTERRVRDIGRDLAEDARDFRLRQRTLEMLLWVVAAVVSLGVAIEAAGGAAADACAACSVSGESHPQAVLAVGLVYTLIAASFYLPAHFALEQLGRDLLSRWAPLPTVSPPDRAADAVLQRGDGGGVYERAAAERDAAGRLLGIGGGASQFALKTFAILAPTVTALVSAAL
jgi:hypothetical protein